MVLRSLSLPPSLSSSSTGGGVVRPVTTHSPAQHFSMPVRCHTTEHLHIPIPHTDTPLARPSEDKNYPDRPGRLNDPRASQVQPFLAPAPDRRYSDYSAVESVHPGPPYDPPPFALAGAPGAPHIYPPPSGSAYGGSTTGSGLSSGLGSVSGAGSVSGRTLSVVNDTGDVAGAAVLGAVAGTAAARASALTAAERKAAEAFAEARPRESVAPTFHADSGVRFDSKGQPIEPGGSSSSSAAGSENKGADVGRSGSVGKKGDADDDAFHSQAHTTSGLEDPHAHELGDDVPPEYSET